MYPSAQGILWAVALSTASGVKTVTYKPKSPAKPPNQRHDRSLEASTLPCPQYLILWDILLTHSLGLRYLITVAPSPKSEHLDLPAMHDFKKSTSYCLTSLLLYHSLHNLFGRFKIHNSRLPALPPSATQSNAPYTSFIPNVINPHIPLVSSSAQAMNSTYSEARHSSIRSSPLREPTLAGFIVHKDERGDVVGRELQSSCRSLPRVGCTSGDRKANIRKQRCRLRPRSTPMVSYVVHLFYCLHF